MKFSKLSLRLNQRGFSHDLVAVAFVGLFAIAGVAYLVASHADSCTTPVSGTTSGTVSEPASSADCSPTSAPVSPAASSASAAGPTTSKSASTPPQVSAVSPTKVQKAPGKAVVVAPAVNPAGGTPTTKSAVTAQTAKTTTPVRAPVSQHKNIFHRMLNSIGHFFTNLF